MAKIIPFEPHLAGQRLEEAVQALSSRTREQQAPAPDELGWQPIARDEAGRTIRWAHHGYRAFLGYVPGEPELVYLDYRHEIRVWELPIEELALGLDTGVLPDPEVVLDWHGERIDRPTP